MLLCQNVFWKPSILTIAAKGDEPIFMKKEIPYSTNWIIEN